MIRTAAFPGSVRSLDCRLGCGLGGNNSKTNLCYENRLPELFLISVVITANLFSVLPFSHHTDQDRRIRL